MTRLQDDRTPIVVPMTLTQAAAALGTTPDNLRGAIHRGTLKATKVGRDWTVRAAEVERYRRDHQRKP